jgi:MFS family permease
VSPSAAPTITPHQGSSSWSLSASGIALVFLVSFFSIGILTDRHISRYDEGLILTGAMRVAGGAVPHRDFYANYGPGQFYVLAGLFNVFGQTVLVERLYDAATKAGIICLVYIISLRIMDSLFAAFVAGLCLLLVGALAYASYPIWPSIFFILLAALPMFATFDGRYAILGLISTGLYTGVVVLFRYDMGVLAVFIVSFALGLYGFIKAGGRRLTSVAGQIAALLLPFWCGAALIILPLLAAYILNRVISDFVFQVVRFPAAHYVEMRSLPFPPIWPPDSIVYLPPVAIIAYTTIELVHYLYGDNSKITSSEKWVMFVVAAFTVGLYFKGFVRMSPIHMAPSIILSLVLLGYTTKRFLTGRHLPLRPALAVLVFTPLLGAEATTVSAVGAQGVALENLSEAAQLARRSMYQTEPSDATGPCELSADLIRMRCFVVSDADRQAVRFVLSNTTPGQPIFVVDGQNDKTFANDNSFYFLIGRRPASKWYHFDPGLQSSQVIQDQIVRDLEEQKPPLIVIDTEFDGVEEHNDSAKHSGVMTLDNYINICYQEVAEMKPYKILRRRRH